MPKSFTVVGVRFEGADLDDVERWREAQPVAPSMSAAIRYLVAKGLQAELKKKDRNG